ncbi:MAG: hypothetical protein AB1696_14085 [Planctomycetota bacterium]
MAAMNTLGKGTIIVYAGKGDWDSLPDAAKDGLRSPEMGKTLPMTVVVDSEASEVIAIVPYAREESERQKFFKDAFRKIVQYAKERKKRRKGEMDKKEDGRE